MMLLVLSTRVSAGSPRSGAERNRAGLIGLACIVDLNLLIRLSRSNPEVTLDLFFRRKLSNHVEPVVAEALTPNLRVSPQTSLNGAQITLHFRFAINPRHTSMDPLPREIGDRHSRRKN